MKINDVLKEDSDSSGDYQKMLTFIKANRVGGVPDDQQIPLALFKELQRQKQQNKALSSELSDAEKRINQAMAAGELSKQELGMHRSELDRERAAGEKHQAAIGQLGQQYAERERASKEQIGQLTNQLEIVKNKPGVDKKAAEALEKQIKELGEKSVPVDRLQELESSIAAVQDMQQVDDSAIKDLVAQVKDAQQAAKELEKTKQTIGKDAEETARRALDQVEQLKQQLAHFQSIEAETTLLAQKVQKLAQKQAVDDQLRAETLPVATGNAARDEITKQAAGSMMAPAEPSPQMSLPGVEKPAPTSGNQINLPGLEQPQAEPARARNIVGRFKQANPADMANVYEMQLQNAIKWAIGKKI